uniref:Secreted protein n=1 Tax=Haemonchus contortus TaxID=6289 RepID=A0A7I4YXW7_HAECO
MIFCLEILENADILFRSNSETVAGNDGCQSCTCTTVATASSGRDSCDRTKFPRYCLGRQSLRRFCYVLV